MSEVAVNLREIRCRIESACARVGRSPGDVCLVAVSKTFGVDAVREAALAGQVAFGESRLQEAEPKITEAGPGLSWHFIGSIQRNKVRRILGCCRVLHSVDSLRLARHIATVAEELRVKPQVFLQVNLGEETSKGGFKAGEVSQALNEIVSLPTLEVLGLMTIPPVEEDEVASRGWFRQLRELRDDIVRTSGVKLPCLSMGMSGDFEVAVEEGATHVRVGSAIFGTRSYRVDGELG